MYHNYDKKNPDFSADSEHAELDLSPDELELLRMLAHDRIQFMKEHDNSNEDVEFPHES